MQNTFTNSELSRMFGNADEHGHQIMVVCRNLHFNMSNDSLIMAIEELGKRKQTEGYIAQILETTTGENVLIKGIEVLGKLGGITQIEGILDRELSNKVKAQAEKSLIEGINVCEKSEQIAYLVASELVSPEVKKHAKAALKKLAQEYGEKGQTLELVAILTEYDLDVATKEKLEAALIKAIKILEKEGDISTMELNLIEMNGERLDLSDKVNEQIEKSMIAAAKGKPDYSLGILIEKGILSPELREGLKQAFEEDVLKLAKQGKIDTLESFHARIDKAIRHGDIKIYFGRNLRSSIENALVEGVEVCAKKGEVKKLMGLIKNTDCAEARSAAQEQLETAKQNAIAGDGVKSKGTVKRPSGTRTRKPPAKKVLKR